MSTHRMSWLAHSNAHSNALAHVYHIVASTHLCAVRLRQVSHPSPTPHPRSLPPTSLVRRQAVCASSCVPMVIEPVALLEKGSDGLLRPYHMADDDDGRIVLRDGSFEADVPLEALAATFGATFSIVSQANPHGAHPPIAPPTCPPNHPSRRHAGQACASVSMLKFPSRPLPAAHSHSQPLVL